MDNSRTSTPTQRSLEVENRQLKRQILSQNEYIDQLVSLQAHLPQQSVTSSSRRVKIPEQTQEPAITSPTKHQPSSTSVKWEEKNRQLKSELDELKQKYHLVQLESDELRVMIVKLQECLDIEKQKRLNTCQQMVSQLDAKSEQVDVLNSQLDEQRVIITDLQERNGILQSAINDFSSLSGGSMSRNPSGQLMGVTLDKELLSQQKAAPDGPSLEEENRTLLAYVKSLIGKIMECDDATIKKILER